MLVCENAKYPRQPLNDSTYPKHCVELTDEPPETFHAEGAGSFQILGAGGRHDRAEHIVEVARSARAMQTIRDAEERQELRNARIHLGRSRRQPFVNQLGGRGCRVNADARPSVDELMHLLPRLDVEGDESNRFAQRLQGVLYVLAQALKEIVDLAQELMQGALVDEQADSGRRKRQSQAFAVVLGRTRLRRIPLGRTRLGQTHLGRTRENPARFTERSAQAGSEAEVSGLANPSELAAPSGNVLETFARPRP